MQVQHPEWAGVQLPVRGVVALRLLVALLVVQEWVRRLEWAQHQAGRGQVPLLVAGVRVPFYI